MLPRVRFLQMEEQAAVAINLETEFTSLSTMRAQRSAAVGADLRTHPPTDVTVAVMNNLDSAVALS